VKGLANAHIIISLFRANLPFPFDALYFIPPTFGTDINTIHDYVERVAYSTNAARQSQYREEIIASITNKH
jgi:hypothetical protein